MESYEYSLEVGILIDEAEAPFRRCDFSIKPGLSVLRNTVSVEQNESFFVLLSARAPLQ